MVDAAAAGALWGRTPGGSSPAAVLDTPSALARAVVDRLADSDMADIQAAIDAGQVHPIFVGDQSRQLLVVSISARRDN